MRGGFRRAAAAVLLALVPACGSGGDPRSPAGVATTLPPLAAGEDPNPATGVKAAARWETVTTLSGSGPTRTQPFAILAGAIQWRVRYSCTAGSLKVTTDPLPRRPGPMLETTCPSEGEGFSIVTGSVSLDVEAGGPWKLVVDQQLDIPLNEPPLPAMATARVVGQGGFYNIEKEGKGTARLYQLADGTRALRIESLYVNQNTDLFVWLDSAREPKTSKDAVSSEYWVLGNLKSTVGDQNYLIPADIPVDRVSSVVIWCQPVAIAYAAAALAR